MAGRIILLWGWRRAVVALAAGAFAVLAEPPFDFPAAAFLSFPVLILLLDGAAAAPGAGFLRRLAPAFATGWWFGFGFFLAGLWWIGNALLFEAERFAWALPLATVALPALLAVYFGLAAALAALCWRGETGRIAALAAAFGLTEWLRSFLFTGFPWNPVGLMAMPAPLLMQSSAVVGTFAMNALAVLLFSLPALALRRRHRVAAAVFATALFAAHAGYGYLRLSAPLGDADTIAVRIVQPSTPLGDIWTGPGRDAIFARLIDLTTRPASDAGKPELVVWPETATPFLFAERPDALAAIGEALQSGQMLMAGAVRNEGGEGDRYYNSLVAIDESGVILDAADKVHLVPFGEYVPLPGLMRALGVEQVAQLVGGYAPAAKRRLIKGAGGKVFLPLICYEAIFPAEVAADSDKADVLINLTVDTWFGDTPGPWQHLRQAQLRAVETGLPMIRAANSGVSAIIDSRGRVLDALALGAEGVLDAKLPLAKASVLTPSSQSLISAAIIVVLAAFACAMNRKSATWSKH